MKNSIILAGILAIALAIGLGLTGCAATSPAINTQTQGQTTLEIYDVSVVTSSSMGQIRVGANPDRWEATEVGHVEISCKTNLPTSVTYICELTGTTNPAGYNLGFSGPYNNPDYQVLHQTSADDLCPFATYSLQIFCKDQEGRQVSYSGTFIPR